MTRRWSIASSCLLYGPIFLLIGWHMHVFKAAELNEKYQQRIDILELNIIDISKASQLTATELTAVQKRLSQAINREATLQKLVVSQQYCGRDNGINKK